MCFYIFYLLSFSCSGANNFPQKLCKILQKTGDWIISFWLNLLFFVQPNQFLCEINNNQAVLDLCGIFLKLFVQFAQLKISAVTWALRTGTACCPCAAGSSMRRIHPCTYSPWKAPYKSCCAQSHTPFVQHLRTSACCTRPSERNCQCNGISQGVYPGTCRS